MKIVQIFTKILYSTGFLGHCLLWAWPLTTKSNQHIYESTYICDQNWVKFPSLVSEIWCSQGFWIIAGCDLDGWPFDLVSGRVHAWPNFGKISLHIYENIVFIRVFGCDLDLWPLTPKSNQRICEPKYIFDHKWPCYCRGTARRATSVEILWPFFDWAIDKKLC